MNFSLDLYGQESGLASFMGIKVGVNYSRILDGDEYHNIKKALFPCANVGLVYSQSFSDNFEFQTELTLSQKGDIYKYYPPNNTSDRVETKVRLNSIELPILLRLKTTDKKISQPYVDAGLGFSYIVGDSNIKSGDQIVNDDNYRDYIDKKVKAHLQYSFVVGAGIRFAQKKKGYVDLDFRYIKGLSNVFGIDTPTETYSASLIISTQQLSGK